MFEIPAKIMCEFRYGYFLHMKKKAQKKDHLKNITQKLKLAYCDNLMQHLPLFFQVFT